jgi:hypothetical protein
VSAVRKGGRGGRGREGEGEREAAATRSVAAGLPSRWSALGERKSSASERDDWFSRPD